MKHFSFLTIFLSIIFSGTMLAQDDSRFPAEWKKIHQLEENGRSKDALEITRKILSEAEKKGAYPDEYKALVYSFKYRMIVEEESDQTVVADLRKKVSETQQPVKKALFSMLLADVYSAYLQSNLYEIVDRTPSMDTESDYSLWDLRRFTTEITGLYKNALTASDELAKVPLGEVSLLVTGDKKSYPLLPTLYDLLAFKATAYFSSHSFRLPIIVDAFEMDDTSLFAPSEQFQQLTFSTSDTLSSNLLTLQHFQQWMKVRSDDPVLHTRIDLLRLAFLKDHFTGEDKDELYINALQHLFKKTSNKEQQAEIQWLIVTHEYEAHETNTNDPNRPDKDKVVQSLKAIIQQYPGTSGANNAQASIDRLLEKKLSVKMEEALVPNKPFKALLEYKDVSEIHYRIISSKEEKWSYTSKVSDVWKWVKNAKQVTSGKIQLPNAQDHYDHSMEAAFDGLPLGQYALVCYTGSPDVSLDEVFITVSHFYVTNLSLSLYNAGDAYVLRVSDRTTGEPLSGVSIEGLTPKWDYIERSNFDETIFTGITDFKGTTSAKMLDDGYKRASFRLTSGEDVYKTSDNYYYSRTDREEQEWTTTVHLLTDRAIYRPGQRIFFKGIVTEKKNHEYRVRENFETEVILKDANWEDRLQYKYTTNEFGSFSGFFDIPKGLLNGNMTLYTNWGSVNVQVEEYKRPSFEVLMDTVKAAYKLNDSVMVSGKALAFSGAVLGQAKVRYEVKRTGSLPIWCFWGRGFWPRFSEEKIIEQGELTTMPDGSFSIRFKALPDKKLSPDNNPIFSYEIKVDVTDINGETQSGAASVRIGYVSIEPALEVKEIQTDGKATDLRLSVRNLQGQPADASFRISIFPLETPATPKIKRYWEESDQFHLTKVQHDQRFPYDLYANEDDPKTWKAGKSVWDKSLNVFGDTLLNALLPSGMYKVEAKVISKGNDTITLNSIVEVRPSTGQTIKPVILDVQPGKTILKPGDQATVSLHSSLKDVLVHYRWMHKGKLLSSRSVQLKGKPVTITYPIDSSVMGGLDFFYEMTAENRFFSGQHFFNVPFAPLDDLQYQWKTFRNKLNPGSKETWELTILGPNREAVAAELLAIMYDASLDQFVPHRFNFSLDVPEYRSYGFHTDPAGSFRTGSFFDYSGKNFNAFRDFIFPQYPALSYFDAAINRRYLMMSRSEYEKQAAAPLMAADFAVEESALPPPPPPPPAESPDDIVFQDPIAAGNGKPEAGDISDREGDIPKVVFRKNFNETAFFFPQMRTDAAGNVVLSFTMPDALTRWKFLGLAHTQNLHYTHLEEEVVTSKELMISPNKMRFFRMGDTLFMSARISNLTDKVLNGQATLHLKDAATDALFDASVLLTANQLPFQVDAKGSASVSWKIAVPKNLEGIVYDISATSGSFTDGETDLIPVLENRMLLTESLPIFINKRGRHTFRFDRFMQQQEKSIVTKSFVLEYTSNPVWHALMALPYLQASEDASSVSLYNRFYANTLAAFILKQIPESKTLLESWKKEGNLKSALEKNPELKSVVLEATPWLRDAASETEQMNQLLQLMDNAAQDDWKSDLLTQWKKLQAPNGGVMWYPGMPESRHLTMMFAEGIGHLRHIGAIQWNEDDELGQMTTKMLRYLDDQLTDDLMQIKKTDSNYLRNDHLWYYSIRQLYLRSYFKDVPVAKVNQAAYDYFIKQAAVFGLKKDVYSMGQLSLVFHRNQMSAESDRLLEALRQNAVVSDQEGMYWKSVTNNYSWRQAPIETQALMIEAFLEAGKDQESVDLLRTWLIRQKQTSRWSNSSATAEACYALLLTGGNWKSMQHADQINMGKSKLKPSAEMAGTGYFKERWEGEEVKPSQGEVSIRKKSSGPSWGAMYWQYWQDIDQISPAQGGLSLKRTIYKVVNTDAGEMLMPITETEPIQTGDKIRVKLEIRAERDMEFVHIQDSRGSGMEPVDVLSGYRYASGLWFYKVTGDAATHWYIERLNKGAYTVEYTVFAAAAGHFISGVAFGECLYDPSFRGHSTGERLVVNP